MKPKIPNETLLTQLQEMEKKKYYTTMNVNMKSVFIAYSRSGTPPAYFIRADYFKDMSESRLPTEYWRVPNPEDPYFVDRRSKMQNIKDLLDIEEKLGIKSSHKYQLKEIKDRYDFLILPRKISNQEFEDRYNNEFIQTIVRDDK